MGKKEKKISVNKLETIVIPSTVAVPLNGAEDVEIVIRRTIPLGEVLQFVEDVVSVCVNEEAGTYTPEILPFAVKSHVLTSYANFNLPSNAEKQYDLIYNTNAVEQVMEHINMEQYEEILRAIDQKISYKCSMMTSAFINQLNALAHRMEEFANKSSALFSGVSEKEISSLMHNISSLDNVDEQALVRAVFDAQKERDNVAADNGDTADKILAFPHKNETQTE